MSGTVHWVSCQSYSASASKNSVVALGKVTARNGWKAVRLTFGRESDPAYDQRWSARTPIVQSPDCTTSAPAGPTDHFPRPRTSRVAVGQSSAGPTPHWSPDESFGVK